MAFLVSRGHFLGVPYAENRFFRKNKEHLHEIFIKTRGGVLYFLHFRPGSASKSYITKSFDGKHPFWPSEAPKSPPPDNQTFGRKERTPPAYFCMINTEQHRNPKSETLYEK